MSIKKLKSNYSTGMLVWVLPHPTITPLTQGGRAQTYTYALRNPSDVPLTIVQVDLVPLQDRRMRIIGGTCLPGIRLAPRATATIILEMNPLTVGDAKFLLRVQHNGFGPPLWLDIVFNIKEAGRPRAASSYLVEETWSMERQRRLLEQEGHRHLAKVHAREHPEEDPSSRPAPEGELQNNILQNPWLDSQRFDGIDPNLNPEPPLNTEARREFDNERREQEMEKQLRLGNMPKFSTAPKPHGPN